MSELVLYEVKDRVATITLNRPEARNALSGALLLALNDALRRAAEDGDARVIVLTGAGETFCAGGDLSEMSAVPPPQPLPRPSTPLRSAQDAREGQGVGVRRGAFVEFFRLMARLGKPTLAAVNGHALGGGLGLVLACDLAIAAETATFGTPEIKVGLWPMMVMASLIRTIGCKKAMELMSLGERIAASEAERVGLINRVVPSAQLPSAVAEWAAKLAGVSPVAFKLGRDALTTISDMPFDEALDYLNGMLTLNRSTEDAREGMRAFLEKRKPEWKGR